MRPPSIVNFERVALSSVMLSVINMALVWDEFDSDPAMGEMGSVLGVAVFFITIGLVLLLIWFVSRKGSIGAKWIYVVLNALSLVSFLTGIGEVATLYGNLVLILSIALHGLEVLAIWLLFRADANAWFRGEQPIDPGVFS